MRKDGRPKAPHVSIRGPRGPPQISRKPGNMGKSFLGRVWGETISPKCLPGTIQSILVAGNLIFAKLETIPKQNHVFRDPGFAQNIARPSPEPDFGFQAKLWILGPQFGPQHQKQKRCTPKKHAEPRLQNQKWSHMVQVMAENHLGQAKPNQAKPGLKLRGQVVYQPIKLSRTFVIHQ